MKPLLISHRLTPIIVSVPINFSIMVRKHSDCSLLVGCGFLLGEGIRQVHLSFMKKVLNHVIYLRKTGALGHPKPCRKCWVSRV